MYAQRYPLWLGITCPKRISQICGRLTKLISNRLSFTTNVRLLFTPLFGDRTVIGRLIGFVTRIGFIIFGFLFVGFLSLITISLPLLWLALPFVLIDELGVTFTIITYLLVFFWYLYTHKDKPIKKIDTFTKKSFRPSALKIANLIISYRKKGIERLLQEQKIIDVFDETELTSKNFNQRLIETEKVKLTNLFRTSFEYAKSQKVMYVEMEHILLGYVKNISGVEQFFNSFGTTLETLEQAVQWQVEKRKELETAYFWQEDYTMPPMGGFGHGMTGRVTPYLDQISTDFTKLAGSGLVKNIIERKTEIDEIARALGGSNKNIMILGEAGSGKTSLIKRLAYEIMRGTEYTTLKNKRIVHLESGGIISGARTAGDIAQTLRKALDEVRNSGDIILFIDEIHNLAKSLSGETSGLSSVFAILEPHLSSHTLQFIGATTIENYRKYIEPYESFARLFDIVEIPETNFAETMQILKYIARDLENKFDINITYPALKTTIDLSKKLVRERVFPDKAVSILTQTCDLTVGKKKILNSHDVEKQIAKVTHIPSGIMTKDKSKKLLNIYNEMKKSVIGQDNAIDHIADALKRAGAGIRNGEKPIASFLFVGTTGVGKTETAKTLSGTYFGDRKTMIRLDMSEYQTQNSISRLIGNPNNNSTGILTEQVRDKPFSVILLDEIEKAHPHILLTFLQVLDDGRLTQSDGRVIDFTNTIIIATSNVGTKDIQVITQRNGTYEEIEKAAMVKVREKFAPEFLNRFNAIIVFNPLKINDIKRISLIMLNKVKLMVKEKNIDLSFSDELISELAERGYNPEWGARPMARTIEDNIETYLAEKLLMGEMKQGDVVKLGTEVFK